MGTERAKWLWLLLRVGLAAVFAVAGGMKLLDPTAFALEIDNYQLLPELAPYLAAALPTTELALAAGLLVLPSPWRRAAALGCMLLMVMFTVAASSALARDLNIDCGCFGTGTSPITWLTIVRDFALLGAAAVLVQKA